MINDYCVFNNSSILNVNWWRSYFHDIHDFKRCERLQCWWFQKKQKLSHVQYCFEINNDVIITNDVWNDAKKKIHHEQNERFQTLQHFENVSKISWSNIEHENSILTFQSCDCWMIEIRSWKNRKNLLKSCDRVDRVCLKRFKSKKKCRNDNVAIVNRNFVIFVVNISFFKINNIIVDKHVDFKIVHQINFVTNHNFDDFVIFLIKKIHRNNDVFKNLMLINDYFSYNKNVIIIRINKSKFWRKKIDDSQ